MASSLTDVPCWGTQPRAKLGHAVPSKEATGTCTVGLKVELVGLVQSTWYWWNCSSSAVVLGGSQSASVTSTKVLGTPAGGCTEPSRSEGSIPPQSLVGSSNNCMVADRSPASILPRS